MEDVKYQADNCFFFFSFFYGYGEKFRDKNLWPRISLESFETQKIF